MRLTVLDYWRLARGMPPDVVMSKAWQMLVRVVRASAFKWRDRLWPTYADAPAASLRTAWSVHLDRETLASNAVALEALASQALEQRVDLLGSGMVHMVPPVLVQGVHGHLHAGQSLERSSRINRSNRHRSRNWASALSAHYQRMDWHLDFKSGFRWDAAVWYQEIVYGDRPGVDVKVPWELSRCQHLPWLALHAQALGSDTSILPWRQSFEDQVCDFMSANPPRYGVNWCCTMDVAIRAANWALTGALFQATPEGLSPGFQRLWRDALRDHGRHIVGNLEWAPGLRSNHYLANVCGLLFVAKALLDEPEARAWLGFASQALWIECALQFLPDGSNFEGSTSYHRLSGEMVVYAAALLAGIDPAELQVCLQTWRQDLVFRGPGPHPATCLPSEAPTVSQLMGTLACCVAGIERFSCAITRPDGQVVQIGDNDSGRFFKLVPAWRARQDDDGAEVHSQVESHIDHGHLIHAARALLATGHSKDSVDAAVIRALAGSDGALGDGRWTEERPAGMQHFADFGLTVYPGEALWCAVRCGPVGQNGQGGHAHNDQLSLEVCSGGIPFIVDPGTCLYTPLPEVRNRFRATAAHNTPVSEREQNDWLPGRLGLFSLRRVAASKVVVVGPRKWVGQHDGFGSVCERRLEIGDDEISGEDHFEGLFAVHWQWAPGTRLTESRPGVWRAWRQGRALELSIDAGQGEMVDGACSTGYGLMESAPRLIVRGLQGRLRWRLSIPQGAS